MKSTLKRDLLKLIPVAIIATVAAVLVVSPAVAAKHDPACSISPGQVALDQSWDVSAWGLPAGGNVNMIEPFRAGVRQPHESTSHRTAHTGRPAIRT